MVRRKPSNYNLQSSNDTERATGSNEKQRTRHALSAGIARQTTLSRGVMLRREVLTVASQKLKNSILNLHSQTKPTDKIWYYCQLNFPADYDTIYV